MGTVTVGGTGMVQRKEYLEKLLSWKDEQVIKVVAGIRRCGKSTLLLQYQQHLIQNGVHPEQIVSVNFEELEYEHLLNYRSLYEYITERLCPDKTTYIFLDEVQKVEAFEKAVDSLLPRKNYDLGFSVENIVFFELLRRGYQVTVGKCQNAEIDFVAQKQGILTYFQVTADMTAEETFNREICPLQEIRDNYEKIILTMDYLTPGNYEGIRVINVLDWLDDGSVYVL